MALLSAEQALGGSWSFGDESERWSGDKFSRVYDDLMGLWDLMGL